MYFCPKGKISNLKLTFKIYQTYVKFEIVKNSSSVLSEKEIMFETRASHSTIRDHTLLYGWLISRAVIGQFQVRK